MKKIKLTQGKYAIVDDEDYEMIMSLSPWYVLKKTKKSKTNYAVRNTFSEEKYGKRQSIRMHRLIMKCPPDKTVDHINGNGLDNRKENLRICNSEENLCNRKKQSGNYTSKYKGVFYQKSNNRWISKCSKTYIGCFKTEYEAAKAYDEKAKEIHREFALLNFSC